MNIFCLLCIPLFFFLRGTVTPKDKNSIWALPLGGVMMLLQYFIGPLVSPESFGLSRWMSGFIDIIGLPVLIPIIVCLVLVMFKAFTVDYANFTLLWMAPLAALHAVVEKSPSPVSLVLVPLLWTALAIGIPFFINCIEKHPRWYVIIPAVLAILVLPFAATTSWWAFFSQQNLLGLGLLAASLIPAIISLAKDSHGGTEALRTQRESEG